MPLEQLQLRDVFPAAPERIYALWIDSEGHALMTGEEATIDPREGGEFSEIPEGQAERYMTGWVDYYFEPLRELLEAITAEAEEALPAAPARSIPIEGAGAKKPARKAVKSKAKQPAQLAKRKPARKAAQKAARKSTSKLRAKKK